MTSTTDLLHELRDLIERTGEKVAQEMRPGRSEDEVRSTLAPITEDPHPDVVAWFTFWEGPGLDRPVHSFAFEHEPIALREVPGIHAGQVGYLSDEYAGYDPRFVPFTYTGAIDSSDRPQRGCAAKLLSGHCLTYVDDLATVLRYWIASRTTGATYIDPATGTRAFDLDRKRDLTAAFDAEPSSVPPFPEQPGLGCPVAVRTVQDF